MPKRRPKSQEKRNVLVAVAGQTPAIITESLWALEQHRGIEMDEIRVITTSQGRYSSVDRLLGQNGKFAQYCSDYQVLRGRIAFSEKNIYVFEHADGTEIEDIRSSQDNMEAADQVFSLIQEWCKRQDEVLFCSVAGGRKTKVFI